jgi:hypothetical protein
MRKFNDIKTAAKNEKNDKMGLILEVLLDIRELLKKQNEMIRRGNGRGSSKA